MRLRLFASLALALAALVAPAAARADNLDAGLAESAPKIMKYLREHNCTNVGVLKFTVKKGNQKTDLKAGPLNANIALRLENALVLANDPKNPIGIIHDADRVALDKKLPSFAKAEGRQKLFETKFPLAWGSATVQPHTFLTGSVRVTADMKKASVDIEAFDRNASNTAKVASFEVPVDRPLLCDLGQSFQLSRSVLKKKRSFEEIEEAAGDDAAQRDKTSATPNTSGDKLLDLEILYDDQKQTIAPDPANGGELRVAEPREGQKVKIAFKNVSDETLGVVVMINGISSNRMQTDEPAQCKKWLPGAGQRYVLEGFQLDEKNVQIWRVASDTESEAMAYSDTLGLISVYVFRSGKDTAVAKGDGEVEEPPPPGLKISRSVNLRRGMTKATASRSAARPSSFADLQKSLGKKTGVDLRDLKPGSKRRGVITKSDETREDQEVASASFPNPQLVMSMQVRYYKPKR